MNEMLMLTWVTLFASAIAVVYSASRFSHLRATNQMIGITASLLLLGSIVVAPFAFQDWFMAFVMLCSVYLLANANILWLWKFHALRTVNIVRNNQRQLLFIFGVIAPLGFVANDLFITFSRAVGTVLAGFILIRVIHIYIHGRLNIRELSSARRSLPTVTFATPARNETHALTKHLQSVVKTDYPKIEFLVLDDCSYDGTSQIIRAFAHDGVRFIKGREPDSTWLGKNHAYQALLEESNGHYILFSGVDTRYQPESITKLINYMRTEKLEMISLMPSHTANRFGETILQPMRYLFTIARSGPRHPPVLSTTWLVRRDFLIQHGGFDAVKSSIRPEQHFADIAQTTGSYRFIASGADIGISSRKHFSSQYETALRNLYPLLHRSLAKHFALLLSMWLLLILPIASLFSEPRQLIVHIAAPTLMYFAYFVVVLMSHTNKIVAYSPLHFLIGAIAYTYISIVSVYRYETDQIAWKDRNICQPIFESRQS